MRAGHSLKKCQAEVKGPLLGFRVAVLTAAEQESQAPAAHCHPCLCSVSVLLPQVAALIHDLLAVRREEGAAVVLSVFEKCPGEQNVTSSCPFT